MNTLQFECVKGKSCFELGQKEAVAKARGCKPKADRSLSLNHAVGRLLWAKRVKLDDVDKDSYFKFERPPLSFNPEEVADTCPLTPDALTLFVHHNFPVFVLPLSICR